MLNKHRLATTGGKGNRGMFIERDPKVVAAGLPTVQQDENVRKALQHYLLQEEVDALVSDAIIPPSRIVLPPLRKPKPMDMRNAGPFGQATYLINPPNKSKFSCLVDELKETSYSSYWKKPLGKSRDPVPTLPEGLDINNWTFGKPTSDNGRLYDIIMPREPLPDKMSRHEPGAQLDRKYCRPAFNPDLIYGHRTHLDKRGVLVRNCLTDKRILEGIGNKTVINTVQSRFLETKQSSLGSVLAPNNNISEVPDAYSFGILKPPDNLPECLTFCEMNRGVQFLRQCLKHLNTVRRALSKRFMPSFFHHFYLNLKHLDTEKTGWLPKNVIYEQCTIKFIRFDPSLMEPLLSMWQAFDGSRIEYKTFVHVINFKEASPEMPKIPDLKPDCLDYTTTYKEMVKPGQAPDIRKMAGLPSGRYFDLDYPVAPEGCAADKICLPHESDVRSCLSPSILTQYFVNHRDMYGKQDPDTVRRVFEAAGEKFTDERFNAIWAQAQKLHSQGWVCIETFRQTLEKHS